MQISETSRLPFDGPAAIESFMEPPIKSVFLDLNDHVLLMSPSMMELLGATGEHEFKNGSFIDFIAPPYRSHYFAKKESLLDINHYSDYFQHIRLDLSDRHKKIQSFAFSMCAVRDREGNPQYFRAVARDMGDKSSPIENYNDAKTGDLLPAVNVLCTAVDANGIFTRCEGAMAKHIAGKRLGRHFTDVFCDMPDAQSRVRRALAGETFDEEVFVEGFWYHNFYLPLKDSEGRSAGAICTSYPISKLKIEEVKLQKLAAQAREASKMREDMLAIVSHEIKGPLSALLLRLEIFERSQKVISDIGDMREKNKTLIDSCRQLVRRVSGLTERILDASSIEDHGLTLQLKRCNVSDILTNVIGIYRDANPSTMFQISVQEECFCSCDANRMEQVFENLLSNAVKYGGNLVFVKLNAQQDKIIFEVSDKGSGISAQDQEKIFERFMRSKDHRNIKGFGMGLYIVRQIMIAHRGTVHVTSEVGRGSTFRVEIPSS
jgi:signal transduction histidine kinase